ncbi:DUF6688 family protein [Myroides odoratimimus]|uniref:DUF6688 domain-containing protein n=1 Tax=Myroides odoratimimus TaxID=76832 RepID=UPI0038D4E4C8
MILYFFAALVLFIGFIFFVHHTFKTIKPNAPKWEYTVASFYFISFIVFVMLMVFGYNTRYNEQLDLIDGGDYEFLGENHIFTYFVYFILYHIAILMFWRKSNKLPPLQLSIGLSILLIGIVLNIFILIQLVGHDLSLIPYSNLKARIPFLFMFFPFLSLILGASILVSILKLEHKEAKDKVFKHRFLNICNNWLGNNLVFVESLVICAPLIVLITIILKIFGQDYDSLSKAFTETATWTFSQHLPPAPKDHQGHYLCTVAASGTPSIVKPLREGNRHGYVIMVNRQLLIANAFEELVQDISPRLHRIIRMNYDKYGYDLCKKITSARRANAIYILMKPLEWLFLVCLYLCCTNPEGKIKRQYS